MCTYYYLQQSVVIGSCFSNSTIGNATYGLSLSTAFTVTLFVLTLPEMFLSSQSRETLVLNEPPYATMVLIAGRLPTIFTNLFIPYLYTKIGNSRYLEVIESSVVITAVRNVVEWIKM